MRWLFKIDRHMVEEVLEQEGIRVKAPDDLIDRMREIERLDDEIAAKKRELEALNAEAEGILQRADEMARALMERTRREAEESRKEAWQEGYQLGREEAQAIVDDAREARKAEMQRFLAQLEDMRQSILNGMEKEIIDFCMTVAEKVVCAALDRDDQLFLSIIGNALQKLKREGQIIARVNPEDFHNHFEKDTLRLPAGGGEAVVTVVPGAGLEPGDCVVETPTDRVDAGVRTVMDGLKLTVQEQMKAEAS
jgi:flagellar assembly protein FliH